MFKDQIKKDFDTLLNLNELAEEHTINGKTIIAVLESESHSERSAARGDLIGPSEEILIMYIRKEQLGFTPRKAQRLDVNGEFLVVESCMDSFGLLEISLIRNVS